MASTVVQCITGTNELRGRSLLQISDLTSEEILLILRHAHWLKVNRNKHRLTDRPFIGKTLALIFEKPSLRTRVTFEVAISELGGSSIYLGQDIQLGKRETVPDIAANLSRWVDCIAARTFAHSTVEELRNFGTSPVINALSDIEHPCQALADLQTIAEHLCDPENPKFDSLKLVFIGDGNNVANSLITAAAKVGMSCTVACPPGYEPNNNILQAAQSIGAGTGAEVCITHNPLLAVKSANIIYTDVWTSMGQEAETKARVKAFAGFQVNSEIITAAAPGVIVMHCLPAHREEEITADVLEGPHSVVLDEAENRLHAQKALLSLIL